MDSNVLHAHERPGAPQILSCPECKGLLYELDDGGLMRFRCRTGHGYTAETVLAEQAEALEAALWIALNTLEESANLSRRLADRARENGHPRLVERYAGKVRDAEARAEILRRVLARDEKLAGGATNGSD